MKTTATFISMSILLLSGVLVNITWADLIFVALDDFESYTDNVSAGEAIWQTWIDGDGDGVATSYAGISGAGARTTCAFGKTSARI